jgi:hypothetical protein
LTLAKRMMPPDAVEGVATDILRVWAPAGTAGRRHAAVEHRGMMDT